jgi:hypothetical protein
LVSSSRMGMTINSGYIGIASWNLADSRLIGLYGVGKVAGKKQRIEGRG